MGNTPLEIVEQVSKGKHNKDHQKLYTTEKKTISSKNNGPLGATIQQMYSQVHYKKRYQVTSWVIDLATT